MRQDAILLAVYLTFSLGSTCEIESGLPCDSRETLNPGSSFDISSRVCDSGKYPKREKCAWYFTVNGCTPKLTCESMDIKGKQGKKCKGDRLRVETENKRRAFCNAKPVGSNGYTDKKPTSYFDIKFKTNRKDEGQGFKCTVTCSGESSTPPPGPSDCECGITGSNRIVGGSETEANEYPWQVALKRPGARSPSCGGSIVSSKTIVTAAHCTIGTGLDHYKVVVNEHDVNVNDGEIEYSVCGKKEHPNYNSGTLDNDVAILTLCEDLVFTKTVAPVCLPTKTGSAYDGVLSTVTGWGTLFAGGPQPTVLHGADVTTITNRECNGDYGQGSILDSMICAKESGKDACQGDSGGPLITSETGNSKSLIGIVSWGNGCADPNFPGVYARVTHNLNFIKNNMAGKQCPISSRRSFPRKIGSFDDDNEN